MELKEAISKLSKSIKNDKEYRRCWVANIAMSYKDSEHQYKLRTGKIYLTKYDKHIIANEAAEKFIKLLFD